MPYKKHFQKYFIISLAILLILSLTPGNGSALDPFDKLVHFLMYFSVTIPLMGLMNNRSQVIFGVFATILLGILIEYIQEYVPERGFEYWDIIANSSGVIFGAYYFYKKKERLYERIRKLHD